MLGSTGVGKTTSVSLLLRKSVAMRPKLRVIIFDPHNEYAAHFPGLAQIIDSDSLELPFWMFRLTNWPMSCSVAVSLTQTNGMRFTK